MYNLLIVLDKLINFKKIMNSSCFVAKNLNLHNSISVINSKYNYA